MARPSSPPSGTVSDRRVAAWEEGLVYETSDVGGWLWQANAAESYNMQRKKVHEPVNAASYKGSSMVIMTMFEYKFLYTLPSFTQGLASQSREP